MDSYILTVTCADKVGIVAAISNFLAQNKGFILESQQFGDPTTDMFFMRVSFNSSDDMTIKEWRHRFSDVAGQFKMKWELRSSTYRMKVVVMASKEGHCLNAILNKHAMGDLPIEIPAVISNHDQLRRMTEAYDIPYHFLPVTRESKLEQEAQVLKILESMDVDLIVLARYMQILSPEFVQKYKGRIINIHHSFLPSFKGGNPYHQAYDRGVKLIGATAHYVTAELDEGPIIEQEVLRVDHAASPAELVSVGYDIEVVALNRALKWVVEQRVFENGVKTVVFK
jgi:formyltetrahydrofolate deformylase